ncbi:MAG: octaprenyl diphosphate synthase, partial [Methylotenera sp.]|nr:octaprenyl diphosphate synthase [Methylotenera sp.]
MSASVSSPQTAITGLIGQDMLAVDRIISQRLSSGVPLVGEVSQHIIQAGGKRLRPALLLLM